MNEATSGCRAKTIGTSLVEYTFVFSVVARVDTSKTAGDNWRQNHGDVAFKMATRIKDFIESGGFEHVDSPVICEDISGQQRELRLHADAEHCEHAD